MTHGRAVELLSIDPLGDPRWDAFVRSRPDAVAYHLAAWARILPAAYRFRARCLAVAHDGRLAGVLPLMEKRGPVSGRRLRSLPVVQTAGPLADGDAARALLLQAALDRARRRSALLVVDSRTPGLDALAGGLACREQPPTWIAPVPPAAGLEAWERARSSNTRRGIARARREGVVARWAAGAADLRAFHRLYLRTMRRHRSLPRTRRQLQLARRELGPAGVFALFLAEHRGRAVAGGVFHVFNGTAELLFNASDDRCLDLRPNHALYRHVIGWAAERGLRRLDLGAAWPDGSLAAFKRQWGGEPVPEYRYVPAGAPGQVDVGTAMGSRTRGRLRERADAAWGRAPLALTALAGHAAYRWL